jgi:dTDP-glucose 4,6-dehydratase
VATISEQPYRADERGVVPERHRTHASGRRIAITGAAGFLGTHCALHALERGYELLLIDTADRFDRVRLSGLADHESVRFVQTDLAESPPELEGRVDAIVHLAALPHVDYSLYEPAKVFRNNTQSVMNVASAALAKPCPMLFSSSVEVYGGNDGALFSETDPLNALSPYAASKIAGEAIVDSFRAVYGLVATTVRVTNLFGPWQAPDRIVPRLVTQALSGYTGEVEPGRIRDYVYVGDAARALLGVVESDAWGLLLNLASGLGTRSEDVGRLLTEVSGDADIVQARARTRSDGRGHYLLASPVAIEAAIGWRPEVDFPAGIERTYAWYADHAIWWKEFEDNIAADRTTPRFILDHSVAL